MKKGHRSVVLLTLSLAASVCLQAQPTISRQPTNESVLLGAAASFSVTATGTGTIAYEWQLDGTNSGDTGQTLGIPVVHHADVGSYDVVVTDQSGSLTSDVVALTLTGPSLIIMTTNTPQFNVITVEYTVAPNGSFTLLETHDLTPPVQWYGSLWIADSGDATNYNWTFDAATTPNTTRQATGNWIRIRNFSGKRRRSEFQRRRGRLGRSVDV